jgi:hypothetical protein
MRQRRKILCKGERTICRVYIPLERNGNQLAGFLNSNSWKEREKDGQGLVLVLLGDISPNWITCPESHLDWGSKNKRGKGRFVWVRWAPGTGTRNWGVERRRWGMLHSKRLGKAWGRQIWAFCVGKVKRRACIYEPNSFLNTSIVKERVLGVIVS